MDYYIVQKRFGSEIHDIREFVTPNNVQIKMLAKDLNNSDKMEFIQNSWNWVIKEVKYPFFNNNTTEFADRHYLETYISPNTALKNIRGAFVTGSLTGLARQIFSGNIGINPLVLARDVIIANGLYSIVITLLNNGNRIYPEFAYQQYDFWNFTCCCSATPVWVKITSSNIL